MHFIARIIHTTTSTSYSNPRKPGTASTLAASASSSCTSWKRPFSRAERRTRIPWTEDRDDYLPLITLARSYIAGREGGSKCPACSLRSSGSTGETEDSTHIADTRSTYASRGKQKPTVPYRCKKRSADSWSRSESTPPRQLTSSRHRFHSHQLGRACGRASSRPLSREPRGRSCFEAPSATYDSARLAKEYSAPHSPAL